MQNDHKKPFSDRLSAAAAAKKAMLERFKARPAMDDPEVVARREAQAALSAERETRLAERKAAREAAEARELAERIERETRDREEKAIREQREAVERFQQAEALAAQQKAARDARYAARKAKK
jgi:hypothetical protein